MSKLHSTTLLVLAWLMAAFAPAAATAQFHYGHIYLSAFQAKGPNCPTSINRIYECNPLTGEVSLFVDLPPTYCGVGGLAFTPDGRYLRALLGIADMVIEIGPDRAVRVVLDSNDGLNGPFGANGLAYDARGNFFVTNFWYDNILRFPYPAVQVPGTVFADAADGVGDGGSLSFSPDGRLYYGSFGFARVIRFNPDGHGTIFDTYYDPPDGILSTMVDSKGTVFVFNDANGGTIYKYPNGDPAKRIQLITFFMYTGEACATLSADESVIYAANDEYVHSVDVETGELGIIAGSVGQFGFGMAVYRHAGPGVPGDMNCDGLVNGFDARVLALAVVDPQTYLTVYSTCSLKNGDLNGDGSLDGADIQAFVSMNRAP